MAKFISLLFIYSFCLQAQQPPLYKIDGLLKRIEKDDSLYVLNFWATWCKPCIEELPSFDSLQKNTPSVKVLLVNLDFAERSEQVSGFLKKKNISAECLILDEVNGNDYIDRISEQWGGAIPATFIRKGNKKLLLEKKLNQAEIRRQILKVQN